MAVVETKVDAMVEDIAEIKADVKGLVAAQQLVALQLSASQAADAAARLVREEVAVAREKRRANLNQWGRAVLPSMLALLGGGVLVGIANFILNALQLGS